MSHSLGPRRSWLFSPAHDARKMAKALGGAADALILDLEDAVAVSEKPRMRSVVADQLRQGAAKPLYVRVNALDTQWSFEDIEMAVSEGAQGIILPKVQSCEDIACAEWAMLGVERRAGRALGQTRLLPIIETARGVARASAIAQAGTRVERLLYGAVDLAADLQLDLAADDWASQQARFQLALASRLAGLPGPLDTAFAEISDMAGLERTAAQARAMGFSGKCCIHPAQIEVVNRLWTPSADAISRARRIVEDFAKAEAAGSAAVQVDGVMIDYPVVERARQLLSQVVEESAL